MVRFDKSTSEKGAGYVRDVRDGRGRARSSARVPGGGKGVGLGALLLIIIGGFLGLDLGGGSGLAIDSGGLPNTGAVPAGPIASEIDGNDPAKVYMQALMFDIQDTWEEYFEQAGRQYEPTQLVIFDDVVDTGCGRATAAVGPFYCPAPGDNQVYVDLGFFDQLERQFGAPGDFAQAYVIAHEIGHHIQSITGISDGVRSAQQRDPGNKNEYSVRQELQADCLAGVWAYSASQRLTRDSGQAIIERGDIAEGLAAAAAVGDDRIQEQAGMRVDPHTWTHGSADQRQKWFLEGFDYGDPERCDTFAVADA